jgi:hypothetical protein
MLRFVAGLALAAGLVAPAHAEIVTIRFQGAISPFNQGGGFASGAESNFTSAQLSYFNSIQVFNNTPGSSYDFTVRVDTDAAGNDPGTGIIYPMELLSGQVGSFTDFSGFTPYIGFNTSGMYRYVNFTLRRTEVIGSSNRNSFATFSLGALTSSGLITSGVLPDGAFQYQFGTASFDIYGANGAFRSAIDTSIDTVTQQIGQTEPPATGAVPEPESWAMLIAGFGLVGAAMRRRRMVPA